MRSICCKAKLLRSGLMPNVEMVTCEGCRKILETRDTEFDKSDILGLVARIGEIMKEKGYLDAHLERILNSVDK